MVEIRDKYNRSFKTLRVSLINTCNLGCVYCSMADSDKAKKSVTKESSPVSTLIRTIEKLHAHLGLQTIRLTGGEPLLYPGLVEVIKGISKLGLEDIRLTTNGFLLERMATSLKVAGLNSMNVSLDAIDEEVFMKVSNRRDIKRILDGIHKALEVGMAVKINAVIMKGLNEDQVFPLLDFAFERNIPIRFLEVMAMGHLYNDAEKHLFYQQDILDTIALRYKFRKLPRDTSATSNYWETTTGNVFGIIANESEPFCHDCNRLRLDSNGNIYGCLSDNSPISIVNSEGDELTKKLTVALRQKQAVRFTGSPLSMLDIGG